MRGAASSHAVRPLALVLLLLAPTLGGCLGGSENEELAKPTDKPIVVPSPRPTAPPPQVFNTSDPGYRVEGAWRIGDGWDYESNHSNVRRVRVLDQRLVNGTQLYLLETTQLTKEGAVGSITRSWVDPRGWLLLNETDERGAGTRYHPGMPLRFFRNSTVTYEVARLAEGGAPVANATVTLASRLFPQHQTLLFPWGYVEARRVEHIVTTRGDGGNGTETTVRWVHRDYLNEVRFQLPSGETYSLTAARAGDFRRGQLA